MTHNDVTGALRLTVGKDYNSKQISSFYTRLLRDEVIAEWRRGPGWGDAHALHVYCHVSGQERWLAPPILRNYIFRRELPLVGGLPAGSVKKAWVGVGWRWVRWHAWPGVSQPCCYCCGTGCREGPAATARGLVCTQ